jgi:hypothetical protein
MTTTVIALSVHPTLKPREATRIFRAAWSIASHIVTEYGGSVADQRSSAIDPRQQSAGGLVLARTSDGQIVLHTPWGYWQFAMTRAGQSWCPSELLARLGYSGHVYHSDAADASWLIDVSTDLDGRRLPLYEPLPAGKHMFLADAGMTWDRLVTQTAVPA